MKTFDALAPNHPYIVKWNGPITPAAAGAIIAAADDFFRREGLLVTLEPGLNDAETAAATANDDHVIGQLSAQGFLRARASGLPIVAFAASYVVSSVEIYSLEGIDLRVPADLAGKKISYKPDSDIGSVIDAIITKYAVPRSELKIVGAEAIVSQLVEGALDVLPGHWESEGDDLRAAKIPFRTFSPDAFGVHTLGTVYAMSERMISLHPEVAKRFLSALFAGWDAAYANLDRTSPIIADFLDDRRSAVEVARFMDGQRRYVRPLGLRMGEFDLARWRALQDLLLQQRLISQPIDLRRAVNFALVSELYRTRLRSLDPDK